ncbi:hypothetical protein QBC35DRAFT_465560 [Podospora australis]|uniref:Uncharacterized protein n=1 Tax=Podospora australis TaxID=1536484 RepID=A0AAN7AGV2_9PEZI|nr:hypothetical protein QBC35DRAFT_465560 [Podospora australis]
MLEERASLNHDKEEGSSDLLMRSSSSAFRPVPFSHLTIFNFTPNHQNVFQNHPPRVSICHPAVLGAALSPFARDGTEPTIGIKWTGRIFKTDAEPRVLEGEAEEILNQILAINPDYVAERVNPEYVPKDSNNDLTRRAETRGCAVMATGSKGDVDNAIRHLNSIGGLCQTPSRQCTRMTCSQTTGTYICSETSNVASVYCSVAGGWVRNIHDNCCSSSTAGLSGHIYQDRIQSVWVGYANCGHAASKRPTDYSYPGGNVNNQCY